MNTLVLFLVIVALLAAWIGFNYWRLKRAARILENREFAALIPGSQLIDLREPAAYHKKHIMGARNIPYEQLKQSLGALRKDRLILLYENNRGQKVTAAALYLKKQGYKDIAILSFGMNEWDGKVKIK